MRKCVLPCPLSLHLMKLNVIYDYYSFVSVLSVCIVYFVVSISAFSHFYPVFSCTTVMWFVNQTSAILPYLWRFCCEIKINIILGRQADWEAARGASANRCCGRHCPSTSLGCSANAINGVDINVVGVDREWFS